jgi:uncharacterized protein (DUF1800 family)
MKKPVLRLLLITTIALVLSSFSLNKKPKTKFPYAKAGLTDRQAAAHLLSRFTFGPRPGDIDQVLSVGLEKWFAQQLAGGLPEPTVADKLQTYNALTLTNAQVVALFPNAGEVRKMAIKDGVIHKDSLIHIEKKEFKEKLKAYALSKGFREPKDLQQQFISQKIIRAVEGANQLHEVLTDFWFNHFNVSATKDACALYIPAYERDVIRPHVVGNFYDLLLATAQSPAMLIYLDNFSSVGNPETLDQAANKVQANRKIAKKVNVTNDSLPQRQKKRKTQGLNENYAREIMELHTLGVDGGYTQHDVTEAARVLTGWTVYPFDNSEKATAIEKQINKVGNGQLPNNGFVHQGDFLFAINRHDNQPKTVLSHTFSDGGYQEGVDLLTLLAHHPSTAKFISKKLAVRFVSDTPPQSVINKMADTFMSTGGNISEVLTTLVRSREFWNAESRRTKTKSPFEYAVSAVRALNASVAKPVQLNNWVTKMGQKLYYYQAPTGYPDRGTYWINTGALLNRMNFGLALADGKVQGVAVNLAALNNNHEPGSATEALPLYAHLIMPERDLAPTIKRLTPFIDHPTLADKIDAASKQHNAANILDHPTDGADGETPLKPVNKTAADKSRLAQVVGIIIGSPEFQRR